MAAESLPVSDCTTPLCVEITKRFMKLKKGRDVLRETVKVYEVATEKLKKERDDLQKAYDEQLLREKKKNEAMDNESKVIVNLEKEIHELKSEISSYKQTDRTRNKDEDESRLLKGHIQEAREEIHQLKSLLDQEKKKSASEMKTSALEKKKAAEARELAKLEKKKAEEERRLAENERKKAEECRICLENFKQEANKVREKLTADLCKAEEARKKLEAEKLKTTREKKRADSETAKAENQKKLLELEMKKTVEEKTRADNLSRMLEEEKKHKEELQKKMEEVQSTAKAQYTSCTCSEKFGGGGGNIDFLRQQLEFEKEKVKYAKRVAKLEKRENKFMMRELHLLKNSFSDTFYRFNMLNDHLLHNTKGTDGEKKVGKSSESERCKVCDNSLASKRDNHNPGHDSGLRGTCCTGLLNCTASVRQCASLPSSTACCTRPTTGTISELRSPVGGYVKNKSQSSVVCSSTASDENPMGSQGRDSVAIATSAELNKYSNQRPVVHKLPCEVDKVKPTMNTGLNMDKNGQVGGQNACIVTSECDANEIPNHPSATLKKAKKGSALLCEASKLREDKGTRITENITKMSGQIGGHTASPITSTSMVKALKAAEPESHRSPKRRKIRDSVNTVAAKLPPLKTRGYAVEHPSLSVISKDLNGRISSPSEMHDLTKKTSALEKKIPAFQCTSQSGNNRQGIHFLTETALPCPQARDDCMQDAINALSCQREDLLCFENMIGADCMRLLDLENVEDEERYKMAVEMPLSPTLPALELEKYQLYQEADTQLVAEKENSVRSHLFDVMNLEVCCNALNVNASTDSELIQKLVENEGKPPNVSLFPEMKGPTDCGNKVVSAEETKASAMHDLSKGSIQTYLSSSVNMECLPCASAGLTGAQLIIVSPKVREKVIMSRILQSKYKFKHQKFIVSQLDDVYVEVLNILSTETTLLPEEKACVFFSILLGNISSRVAATSEGTMGDGILSGLESFLLEINRVMSSEDTMSLFRETCQLDILVSLIEDFLIDREVLMYAETSYGPSGSVDSPDNLFHVDGWDVTMSPRPATVYQFVAGSVILASISAAVDKIGILLEASYKFLRNCKNDRSWTLLALHAFASVCGNKFLDMNDCILLITVIRSMVSLLEGAYGADLSISNCYHSSSTDAHIFPPCKDCPFGKGAVSVDKLTDLLLELLQNYCMIGNGNQNAHEAIASSVCTLAACITGDEQSSNSRSEPDSWVSCGGRRVGFNSRKLADDLPQFTSWGLVGQFSDIVSLVELVASYMSWGWTYCKVITRLSKMLQSCQSDVALTALIVLVGKLGRSGIDTSGHQQNEIVELRCTLSTTLDACINKGMIFPAQLAAVGALLNILPLHFEDIVGEHDHGISLDTSQSNHAKQIKKWFSDLSIHLQSLSRTYMEKLTSKK